MNKPDQAKEQAQLLQSNFPGSYLPVLLEASIQYKHKKNPTRTEELLQVSYTLHSLIGYFERVRVRVREAALMTPLCRS
jgi:hypothetical protein